MAVFATEAGVRLRVQVDDVAVASGALVEACIAEAHERVLGMLDGSVDLEAPPEAVVQGETVLCGAILFGALARQLEKEALVLLAPYGMAQSGVAVADVTPTTPVLGA